MRTPIILSRTLATQLLEQARQQPNQEVCGLVVADAGQPSRVIPIRNASQTPHNSFSLDESEHLAARRKLRDAGARVVGVYHSHPATPPEPSPRDLQAHDEAAMVHFVISLNTKGVLEMRAYRLEQGQVQELPLALA